MQSIRIIKIAIPVVFCKSMKYFLFGFTGLFLCVHTMGQTVEWSNQQKFKNKTNYTQVLGENSSGVFVVRSRNYDFRENLTIEKYKGNLGLEVTKDLTQPAASRIERAIVAESGLLEFASAKNTTTGKIDLVLTPFDNTLTPLTPLTILSVDAGLIAQDRKFVIRASTDKKYFTVLFLTSGSDKSKSILNVHGYDAAYNQKYSRRFSLSNPAEDVNLLNMECDNKGNVFALMSVPMQAVKKKDRDARSYFLYAYYPENDNMLEYDIAKDSAYINEAAIVVNNYSKTVNIAGFYSDRSDNRCIGNFFYKLDVPSTQMQVKRFDSFDLSFVSRVAGIMKNENELSLSDLKIRKLVANSDGGCTIIAEKYYETRQAYTYTVNGFPQTSYRTVYNYDEIIMLARNGDGTVRFRDFVKKNHTSISDGGYYSSFVTILNNDKISLVYNYDVNSDSDIMLVTLSNKGVVDSKVLIKSMSYYVTIMPSESKQVSANSAIITSLKDRRFCLMRLTL